MAGGNKWIDSRLTGFVEVDVDVDNGGKDENYVPILIFRKTEKRLRDNCKNSESFDEEINRLSDEEIEDIKNRLLDKEINRLLDSSEERNNNKNAPIHFEFVTD